MDYEQVIKKHRGLILKVVNGFCRYNNQSYSRKDLEQVAHISLLQKLDKFDASRGQITTFIVTCIKNDIIKYIKKHKVDVKPIQSDVPANTGELRLFEYETNDPVYNEVLRRKMNGDTHAVIVDEMGLSQSKLKSILVKIKKNILADL